MLPSFSLWLRATCSWQPPVALGSDGKEERGAIGKRRDRRGGQARGATVRVATKGIEGPTGRKRSDRKEAKGVTGRKRKERREGRDWSDGKEEKGATESEEKGAMGTKRRERRERKTEKGAMGKKGREQR